MHPVQPQYGLRRTGGLVLWWGLVALAQAVPCDEVVSLNEVAEAVAATTVLALVGEDRALEPWHAEANIRLRCAGAIPPAELAAQIHRMEGAVAMRRGDSVGASRAFAAARDAWPQIPVLPEAPATWTDPWERPATIGAIDTLPTLTGADWHVDGLETPFRFRGRPSILQLVDDREVVLWSGWLPAAAPFPDELAALVAPRSGKTSRVPDIALGLSTPLSKRWPGYLDAEGEAVRYRRVRKIARYDGLGLRTARRRGRGRVGLLVTVGLAAGSAYGTYLLTYDTLAPGYAIPANRLLLPAAGLVTAGLTTLAVRELVLRKRRRRELVEAAERVIDGEAM